MLEIIGALAITGLLIYLSLANFSVYVWSDYGFWDTTRWNWRGLWLWWVANVVVAILWYILIGSRIAFI